MPSLSNFFSIIPARYGSKGIIKKNLHPVMGKPLIQWTLEASIKSKHVSETIISSDSLEILDFNNSFKYLKHKRKAIHSNDNSRSEEVIYALLEEMDFLKEKYEYFILLQPTSPLRTHLHINQACKKILDKGADSLISVKKVDNSILKSFFVGEDGNLRPGFGHDFPFMPRQELPNTFMPNGAIYISKISSFIKNKSLISKKNSFIIMDEASSIDIDTIQDISEAELLLDGKKN